MEDKVQKFINYVDKYIKEDYKIEYVRKKEQLETIKNYIRREVI